MKYSTTIAAVAAQLLVVFLPMFGIQIGTDELTNGIQTIVVILTGLWIWVERVRRGDITVFGKVK